MSVSFQSDQKRWRDKPLWGGRDTTETTLLEDGSPPEMLIPETIERDVLETGGLDVWLEPAGTDQGAGPLLDAPDSSSLKALHDEAEALRGELVMLRGQKAVLQSEILYRQQNKQVEQAGIYEIRHPMARSVDYSERIKTLRQQMETTVREGSAIVWQENPDATDPLWVRETAMLCLRAYNMEADNIVLTLRPYQLEGAINRLTRAKDTIADLGAVFSMEITGYFHRLRVEELELVADYQECKAREIEREAAGQARLKEEEAVRLELREARARLIAQLEERREMLVEALHTEDPTAVARAQKRVARAEEALADLTDRLNNFKAGYLYVLSNVGVFGPGVVRIGTTRRLDVQRKVDELNMEMAFPFDIHLLVYSDNAVGLETFLKSLLETRKMNRTAVETDYFRVTPENVRKLLIREKIVVFDYKEEPDAEAWHKSGSVPAGTVIDEPV